MAETALLTVDNLTKRFRAPLSGDTIFAVNGVSFSLGVGETVGLVGESGSGKSTIGRAIARLLTPSEGAVVFAGEDIARWSTAQCRTLRDKIQIVFQNPWGALNPRMRIGRLIEEPLKLHSGLDGGARRQRVEALADRVRLSREALDRFPHELSGGQLQRVCIARAIATKPRLIILDEPTSSLDLSVRADILDLLAELQRETGAAMLFISHDLETVRFISHRVLVLYLGRIVEMGPSQRVFERPAHPYTRALLSARLPVSGRRGDRVRLEGEIPSPLNLPKGCVFASRCPIAIADCLQRSPGLDPIGADSAAACFRLGVV
ncbi:MAG: ATP-binding cassette domain-containing protein [Alphaproteobacteria bacterium]|nr:ATP-binding cassette domain-containing protein [Alphaproteobacteria bacterium]